MDNNVRRIGQLLDIPSKVALPVYQDNTSTIKMAYMGKGSAQSNSKIMDLKYFWIKEQLDKGLLRLVYHDTDSMPVDFFASPRTGSSFRHFRSIRYINIQCIVTFKECVKKCSYRYLYS